MCVAAQIRFLHRDVSVLWFQQSDTLGPGSRVMASARGIAFTDGKRFDVAGKIETKAKSGANDEAEHSEAPLATWTITLDTCLATDVRGNRKEVRKHTLYTFKQFHYQLHAES